MGSLLLTTTVTGQASRRVFSLVEATRSVLEMVVDRRGHGSSTLSVVGVFTPVLDGRGEQDTGSVVVVVDVASPGWLDVLALRFLPRFGVRHPVRQKVRNSVFHAFRSKAAGSGSGGPDRDLELIPLGRIPRRWGWRAAGRRLLDRQTTQFEVAARI